MHWVPVVVAVIIIASIFLTLSLFVKARNHPYNRNRSVLFTTIIAICTAVQILEICTHQAMGLGYPCFLFLVTQSIVPTVFYAAILARSILFIVKYYSGLLWLEEFMENRIKAATEENIFFEKWHRFRRSLQVDAPGRGSNSFETQVSSELRPTKSIANIILPSQASYSSEIALSSSAVSLPAVLREHSDTAVPMIHKESDSETKVPKIARMLLEYRSKFSSRWLLLYSAVLLFLHAVVMAFYSVYLVHFWWFAHGECQDNNEPFVYLGVPTVIVYIVYPTLLVLLRNTKITLSIKVELIIAVILAMTSNIYMGVHYFLEKPHDDEFDLIIHYPFYAGFLAIHYMGTFFPWFVANRGGSQKSRSNTRNYDFDDDCIELSEVQRGPQLDRFMIRYRSFDRILENAENMHDFAKFSVQDFTIESLTFYESWRRTRYKRVRDVTTIAVPDLSIIYEWRQLYGLYFAVNADLILNIDSRKLDTIREAANKNQYNLEMYDEVAQEIYLLLYNNTFQRWRTRKDHNNFNNTINV